MDQVIYNEILPPVIFFVVFSVAFSLLELIVIFLLDRIESKHWEFMIDVVIRTKVHHGKLIKYSVLIILAAFSAILLIYTPLIDVLASSTKELKIFAVLLALVMFLIYAVNVRKSTKIAIEKKIYETIFFVMSLVLYVSILILANESYGTYAEYIKTNLINPAVQSVEAVTEEQKKNQLLKKFREQYLNNECEKADYSQEEEKAHVVKNFVLIAKEPELAYEDGEFDPEDPKSVLKGMRCLDGENTFILTANGNWYWVIEEYLQ